jgi:hypothetical protein
MRRITRTTAYALLAGVLLAASLWLAAPGGMHHMSETSAVAAPPRPTATYVSELGQASVQPPRHAVALPASGSGLDSAGIPWSQFAGLGLALGGVLLLHIALTMRPRRAAHS